MNEKMQWPDIVKLVNEVLGCEAHVYPCERGSIGHEMTGINFNSLARIIDRVQSQNMQVTSTVTPTLEALKTIEGLQDKYGQARHVALELSGVMREYIDLPYNGLRQQLLKTLDRYQARLEGLRKDHFEDLAKPIALPDRKDVTTASYTACLQNDGWNNCLDEITKINAIQPKANPAVVQMREAMERRAARQQIAELHIGEAWLTVTYSGLKWYHWNMAGMGPTPLSIEEFDEILAKELAPC